MQTVRMYTGKDGITHLEDVNPKDLKLPAKEVSIHTNPLGFKPNLHITQKRSLIIVRTGKVKLIVEDGSSRVLNAGDIILAEDTTGKGHGGVKIADEPCVLNTITLA